jgi:hypothetical protein
MADDDSLSIGLPEMTIGLQAVRGLGRRFSQRPGRREPVDEADGRGLRRGQGSALEHHRQRARGPESARQPLTTAGTGRARGSPEAVCALKRRVYDGAAGELKAGLATERKLFLWAGGSKPARRGMRAFCDAIAREGRSPWADAELLRPWQAGKAIDLGSPPPSSDEARPR